MNNDLSSRAMLVRLNVSQWTARKCDKKITGEVNRDHGASADAGRYNKNLLAADALKPVVQAVGAARTFHYANTLPWRDDGARILPAANFQEYKRGLAKLESEFRAAVDTFIGSYGCYVNDARARLNGMFSEADYPAVGKVRDAFSWSTSADPLPVAEDFRSTMADIPAADIEALKADAAARMDQAVHGAMLDLWARLSDVVGAMAGKLSDEKAIFRDSLVGNVADLCNILPRLNLAGDAVLESFRVRVASSLAGLKPQELRDNGQARAAAAAEAQAIADKMAAYMGAL